MSVLTKSEPIFDIVIVTIAGIVSLLGFSTKIFLGGCGDIGDLELCRGVYGGVYVPLSVPPNVSNPLNVRVLTACRESLLP